MSPYFLLCLWCCTTLYGGVYMNTENCDTNEHSYVCQLEKQEMQIEAKAGRFDFHKLNIVQDNVGNKRIRNALKHLPFSVGKFSIAQLPVLLNFFSSKFQVLFQLFNIAVFLCHIFV